MTLFDDRVDAGHQLARRLLHLRSSPGRIVLALPRGGVPVAAPVALALDAPLDVFVVRKLGAPAQPELAIGAIAEGGVELVDAALVQHLGLSAADVAEVARRERVELSRREALYRGERASASLRDRTVILVDDGAATGATMEVAVSAVRRAEPAWIVVALPVASREAGERLGRVADALVCVETPRAFASVGGFYRDFAQTTDEEVRALLAR